MNRYLLLTAAKNEEDYIEKPLSSVCSQTELPEKWIIVDDGSTDRTVEIIKQFQNKFSFIELLENTSGSTRNFGSKARAINFAYKTVKNDAFEFVGNLDADVSFDAHYYENVLTKFQENPKLGIAGGIRYDLYNGKFIRVKCARNSVGGPFQLFQRKCFETVGGYVPLAYGGIDAVAETTARMHKWDVESFPDLKVYHYRTTGTASSGLLGASFKTGIKEYVIGYHPFFHLLKAVSRFNQKPYMAGSLFCIAGYLWAAVKRYNRPLSDDFVRFLRSEQISRLQAVMSF